MNDTLKYIWVGLVIFCILGLLISIPVQNYQKAMRKAALKRKFAPQARLDATQKYMESYENGMYDKVYSFGDSPELKILYELELEKKVSEYDNSKTSESQGFRKPLYIRDKKNPNILYKYSDTRDVNYFKVTGIARKKSFNTNSNVRRPLYVRDKNNYNIYYPVYP